MSARIVRDKWWRLTRSQPILIEEFIHLSADDPFGILYAEIVKADYGLKSFDGPPLHRILQEVEAFLKTLQSVEDWSIASYRLLDQHLFVMVKSTTDSGNFSTRLYSAADAIKRQLDVFLKEHLFCEPDVVDIRFGTSLLRPVAKRSFESTFFQGALSAMNQAKTILDARTLAQQAEFIDILQHRRIQSYFQPIVSLWTAETFGYEALSRGPAGSDFFSPLKLFDYADRHGQLHELEGVTLNQAITAYQTDAAVVPKLFLNINAVTLLEDDHVIEHMMSALQCHNMKPYDVVLEVTERRSVDDFVKFQRVLQRYRRDGFLLAIDDVGSGYSSLQTIVELKPDFIKIDRSLIRGIQDDYVKEAVVQGLCQTASTFDCATIAEGIETREELSRVAQIGVTYGQGFFLGRPTEKPKGISQSAGLVVRESMTSERSSLGTRTIGQIAEPSHTFPVHAESRKVVQFFNRHEDVSGVVIVNHDKPIGLVMREKLFRKLATKYGVSLFWNRRIEEVMDRRPLILDENISVENSSLLSMGRHVDQLYDLIIVTRNGKLVGSLTIQTVLNTITKTQIELARDANPLTGLPGNGQIEREIPRRIAAGKPFSLMYIDLDNFKGFNDTFGFRQGDQAIQALAECIRQSESDFPESNSFVGHIGGDDFILLTACQSDKELARSIQQKFALEVEALFPALSAGSHVIRDRLGRVIESGGLTLSISVLSCDPSVLSLHPSELSLLAGVLKQKAKERGGNQIVFERHEKMSKFDEISSVSNEFSGFNIDF